MYNLIEEKWIPILRRSGNRSMIAPWEIADSSDPSICVDFTHGDLNSATTQFLIAILQTVYCPGDANEWLDRVEKAPSEEELHRIMDPVKKYFDLEGEDIRYMQESSLIGKNSKPIYSLQLFSPGENTIKLNKDFFVKRSASPRHLCKSCTAATLTALQMFAKSGGSGYNSSARGTSPLNTIALGNTLWETCYLNVLTKNYLERTGGDNWSATPFSWVRTEIPKEIQGEGSHPAEVLWATPRRIRLENASSGKCELCGKEDDCYANFMELQSGQHYREWLHPLCPIEFKNGEEIPKSTEEDLFHLNNWTAMAYKNQPQGRPALCIEQIMGELDSVSEILGKKINIWITGYLNNNAEALKWVDSDIPVFIGYSKYEDEFLQMTSNAVKIANFTVQQLLNGLKSLNATISPSGKTNWRWVTLYDEKRAGDMFWDKCDYAFNELEMSFDGNNVEQTTEKWMKEIRKIALEVFDSECASAKLGDYEKIVLARKKLEAKITVKKMQRVISL